MTQLARLFPDEAAAERRCFKARWPHEIACPPRQSANIGRRENRKPQPYHCRACRRYFSVKTGTFLHASKLGLRTWVYALYLLATLVKGVSSLKLAY